LHIHQDGLAPRCYSKQSNGKPRRLEFKFRSSRGGIVTFTCSGTTVGTFLFFFVSYICLLLYYFSRLIFVVLVFPVLYLVYAEPCSVSGLSC